MGTQIVLGVLFIFFLFEGRAHGWNGGRDLEGIGSKCDQGALYEIAK